MPPSVNDLPLACGNCGVLFMCKAEQPSGKSIKLAHTQRVNRESTTQDTPLATLANRMAGLFQHQSLRAAVVYGIGGAGFSLGTLLLARYLSPADFGLLALLIAMVQVGIGVGPAGVDLLVNRHHPPIEAGLALRVLVTSFATSVLVTTLAGTVYGIASNLLPTLFLLITAAGVSRVGSAHFQSARRFGASLFLFQVHNFILLLSVPLALAFDAMEVAFILGIIAGGHVATAVLGWSMARQKLQPEGSRLTQSALWREGLSGVGISIAMLLLAQTERYVIPLLLSFEDMALFSVLAAVVIAPFRMMQGAVAFTLLPRLRTARDGAAAIRIVRNESLLLVCVGIAASAVVILLGRWVVSFFAGDTYKITLGLMSVAIVVGWIRLAQSVSVATVNARGTARSLRLLNRFSWLSLGVALLAAWFLSRFGLVGIIVGVGLGWLTQTIAATLIASRIFRSPR